MSTKLFFGIRLDPSSYERVQLDSIDLQNKISQLKEIASEKTNVSSSHLELVFCGNILENNSTLESCGIRPGVTIHVLKKKEKEPPRKTAPLSEADIQHLVTACKNAVKNPNYRTALQRLSRPEVLENIIVATAGLAEDPVAISILQDPELLSQLCDVNTVRRVAETHPSLVEAADSILAVIHDEAASPAINANAGTSSGYSYSLDALSDDEEMDSSQSSDSQPRPNRAGDAFSPQITTAQLAAALASATAGNNSVSPSPSSSSVGSNPVITTEMFSQAMQQVFGTVAPSTPGSGASRSASTGSDLGDLEATSRQLSRHLQQMHELGLTNDAVNLQALQATDWNVQQAIELVFSGAILGPELDEDE